MRNRVRELLDGTASVAALIVTLTDSVAVELAALAGFDLVVLECEHGVLSRATVLAVMIEEVSAVEKIDEILAVPGIDLVIIGPGDLSASANAIGLPDDPRLTELVDRAFAACRHASVKFGMPVESAAHSRTA